MNKNKIISSILAAVMAVGSLPSMLPQITAHAAQSNEYVDPADVWVSANGRTNELDINATITYETYFCPQCNMETTSMTYRVPEYTRSGETAYNHGVFFSDGMSEDGTTKGNPDNGTPGVDAFYTGYHYTKTVCQNCGIINSSDGKGAYSYNKNVYSLNACSSAFFLDFDNTTYEQHNDKHHITTLKRGQYCQFCKGTKARATEKEEAHGFTEHIDAQLGNQRFHITGECNDCGYIKNDYAVAKSVVQSYYGNVDGKAHTVTVSDLSESGVNTKIRYGESANNCTLTSAPNYTEAGYYPVYYEIRYTYDGESMTENGVSYVWLIDTASNTTGDTASKDSTAHVHDFHFLETVRPTCTELGYDRFQCMECGALQKTNYTPSTGHDYNTVVVREASCTQGGFELHMCKTCGAFYTAETSMKNHRYETNKVEATCTKNGYTEHRCIDCGFAYTTDLTPLAKHDYREKVTSPTCTLKGYSTYTCNDCGESYISNYTESTGHSWDNGHVVTNSTCDSEGVIEYHCKNCDEKMIKAESAKGHKAGPEATCTKPQTCTECGAVLAVPKGHQYSEDVMLPTCTSIGYTTYTCNNCDFSYTGKYTDKTEHHYHSVITPATCTSLGFTTYTCTECEDEYISDYTDKKPHEYEKEITPATCTSMGFTTYTCKDCDDSYISDYTDVLEHNYTKQVVPPTCTEHGYSIYTCPDCGKEYIGDYKDTIEHSYDKSITAPTCEEMGFTTYTCSDCGYSYVADYTNPKGHSYKEEITAPTCTEIGFSTFTCEDCGKSYVGNEKAKLPHDYKGDVTAPTCDEMGFVTYTCNDCGDSYVGDYTNPKGHSYKEEITAPTCTEIGFSTFTCEDCGKSYVGNEKAKLPHDYEKTVTAPTCTELGYTTYICKTCGDTYTGVYTEASGHTASGWIIDVAATIENEGSKHIECTVCGKTLKTSTIPQLSDNDNSDEDGKSKVGNYSILVTDKNNKPIFKSEVSIDKNDNITIRLPEGRLLSADDITTVTVTYSENQKPAKDIAIFVADMANNAATGRTDENGQLRVPNSSSSTGDSNGTVTDSKNTYVVIATDKKGELIENCGVTIGENYSINVTLPKGTAFDKDNRITVTVVTEKGNPVQGLRIQLIGGGDYIESGYTNIRGQVTLPVSNTDVTDENGNANVGDTDGDRIYDYIVVVSNADGFIKDALITLLTDDNSVLVCLPEGTVIDYYNRISIKVMKTDGTPVQDWKVTVYNKDGSGLRTELTDEDGIVIVPPLSEAAFPQQPATPNPEEKATPLPGVGTTPNPTETPKATSKPDATETPKATDKPTVTPTEKPKATDKPTTTPTEKPKATENPKATEKPEITTKPSEPTNTPAPTPEPDMGDGVVVQNKSYKYRVFVWDNNGAITEFGLVKLMDDGNLEIELPSSKALDPDNKTNIKVVNEDDKTPVKGITVNVTDAADGAASDITNSYGIAIVPVSDTDITDGYGNALVKDKDGNIYNVNVATETKGNIEGAAVTIADGKITVTLPDGTVIDYKDRTTVTVTDRDNAPVSDMTVNVKDNKGGDRTESTDADGKVIVPPVSEDYTDGNGNASVNDYTVIVEDTKAKIENAYVEIKDGKISVKLPDTNELTTSNQTTVTVTDKDSKAVQGLNITISDKNNKTASDTTNSSGKVTLPKKTSGGGGGSSSGGSGGGGSSSTATTYNVTVVDKDGKTVSVTKSIKDKDITLTLPTGKTLDGDDYYTITVTDRSGKVQPDINVLLKDKNGNEAKGTTDSKGQLVLPAKEHKSYIQGYENGEVRPEGNMTRAEAAAIFARNIAEIKNEKITNSKSTFTDVDTNLWYNQYIAYLDKYGIIEGYNDGTFAPDANVTRAEFVTMCSRFYKLIGEVATGKANDFKDVPVDHWAVQYINSAVSMGWIKGYADNSFKPDSKISRAEVVTIVNRATEREADENYISKNMTAVNPFTDLTDKTYWAYYEILEAANTHMAVTNADGEVWVQ